MPPPPLSLSIPETVRRRGASPSPENKSVRKTGHKKSNLFFKRLHPYCSAYGIRTRVTCVRGTYPRPLDESAIGAYDNQCSSAYGIRTRVTCVRGTYPRPLDESAVSL